MLSSNLTSKYGHNQITIKLQSTLTKLFLLDEKTKFGPLLIPLGVFVRVHAPMIQTFFQSLLFDENSGYFSSMCVHLGTSHIALK